MTTLAERLAAIRAGHDAPPVSATSPATNAETASKPASPPAPAPLTIEERLTAIEARLAAAFGNKV